MEDECRCMPAMPPCAFCTKRGGGNADAPCRYMSPQPVRTHGSNKDWRTCGHPAQPLGNPVCRCKGGCRPTCGGYVVGPTQD